MYHYHYNKLSASVTSNSFSFAHATIIPFCIEEHYICTTANLYRCDCLHAMCMWYHCVNPTFVYLISQYILHLLDIQKKLYGCAYTLPNSKCYKNLYGTD